VRPRIGTGNSLAVGDANAEHDIYDDDPFVIISSPEPFQTAARRLHRPL
jgi:hypothetical protein